MVRGSRALIALLAACGTKPSPAPLHSSAAPQSCDDVMAYLGDYRLGEHCRDEAWTETIRACLLAARDATAPCGQLTPTQREAFSAVATTFTSSPSFAGMSGKTTAIPSLAVTIAADGSYVCGGASLSVADLDAVLATVARTTPKIRIFVMVDAAASKDDLATLTARAKRVGLTDLFVMTQ